MSKKRVHEIAKELKGHGIELDDKEVVTELAALGYDVKSHSSSLDDDQANAAVQKILDKRKPKQAAPPVTAKGFVVRRRWRASAAVWNARKASTCPRPPLLLSSQTAARRGSAAAAQPSRCRRGSRVRSARARRRRGPARLPLSPSLLLPPRLPAASAQPEPAAAEAPTGSRPARACAAAARLPAPPSLLPPPRLPCLPHGPRPRLPRRPPSPPLGSYAALPHSGEVPLALHSASHAGSADGPTPGRRPLSSPVRPAGASGVAGRPGGPQGGRPGGPGRVAVPVVRVATAAVPVVRVAIPAVPVAPGGRPGGPGSGPVRPTSARVQAVAPRRAQASAQPGQTSPWSAACLTPRRRQESASDAPHGHPGRRHLAPAHPGPPRHAVRRGSRSSTRWRRAGRPSARSASSRSSRITSAAAASSSTSPRTRTRQRGKKRRPPKRRRRLQAGACTDLVWGRVAHPHPRQEEEAHQEGRRRPRSPRWPKRRRSSSSRRASASPTCRSAWA